MMNKFSTSIVIAFLCILAAPFIGAAADAPGVRVLGSLKDAYAPVIFDHPKHAAIAASCAACHHEHAMGSGLPCKQCHALTPATFRNSVSHSFSSCKSCHGEFDRDNAGMPGLKTAYHRRCFTCHRGMGDIGTDPKGCTELCHARKADRVGSNSGN